MKRKIIPLILFFQVKIRVKSAKVKIIVSSYCVYQAVKHL